MKPLRVLLNKIESETEDEEINWWEPMDPKSVPKPERVSLADMEAALNSTKSSCGQIPKQKYEQWFKSMGSV